LSPLAAKVIHARIAAAVEREEQELAVSSAGGGNLAQQEDGAAPARGTDGATLAGAGSVESVAARAQELLDELYAILPPK